MFVDVARNQIVFTPRPDGKISNPLGLARVHVGVTKLNGERVAVNLVDNGAGELVPAEDGVISGIETEGSDASDPFSGSNDRPDLCPHCKCHFTPYFPNPMGDPMCQHCGHFLSVAVWLNQPARVAETEHSQ